MNERENATNIEVLLKEYEIINQSMRQEEGKADRLMGIGLTVLIGGFAFGIKENLNELLLFVPFGFFYVLFYGLTSTTTEMTLGGYKKHLEERINTALGESILIWEGMAPKLTHTKYFLIVLYLILAIVFGLTVFVSLQKALRYYETIFFVVLLTIEIVLCVALVISMSITLRAYNKAYQFARSKANQKVIK